ncbi:unnamed protein product, partial [Amoebophrya sp. A120]
TGNGLAQQGNVLLQNVAQANAERNPAEQGKMTSDDFLKQAINQFDHLNTEKTALSELELFLPFILYELISANDKQRIAAFQYLKRQILKNTVTNEQLTSAFTGKVACLVLWRQRQLQLDTVPYLNRCAELMENMMLAKKNLDEDSGKDGPIDLTGDDDEEELLNARGTFTGSKSSLKRPNKSNAFGGALGAVMLKKQRVGGGPLDPDTNRKSKSHTHSIASTALVQ